jgi:hypothetical protein
MRTSGPARVGIVGPSDHPVFSVVGEGLEARGYAVSFFDANTPIDRAAFERVSLLASKQTRPASVPSLFAAARMGVPTWNSATGVLACVSRFSRLCLLAGAGFDVPEASRTRPAGEYVAKGLYHWQSTLALNGEGDVYEELLDTDPVDYKNYVVDDGASYRPVVLRATSKLTGEKRFLGEAKPDPELVNRVIGLMDRLGMCAIGVDVVRVEGSWYAVDLNPCPGFTETGLEGALIDSMPSHLP